MSFSPTGSTGVFTVGGLVLTFDHEVGDQQSQRNTTADTAEHHIPYSARTYLQSAGRSFTMLSYTCMFASVADYEAFEAHAGDIGALQTLQDGLWLAATLKEVRYLRQWADGRVEAVASFNACRIASG